MKTDFPEMQYLRGMLDVFSGVDGGVSFIHLRAFVGELLKKNDPASVEILKILQQTNNLCEMILKREGVK